MNLWMRRENTWVQTANMREIRRAYSGVQKNRRAGLLFSAARGVRLQFTHLQSSWLSIHIFIHKKWSQGDPVPDQGLSAQS